MPNDAEPTNQRHDAEDRDCPRQPFLSCSDGSFARVAGCIESFTNKVGLVISSVKGKSVEVDTLCLAIGDGTSCEFFFGDHREMPEPVRASMAKRYGDTRCWRSRSAQQARSLAFSTIPDAAGLPRSEKLFR
jgi:hypothetical protein